MTNKTEIGMVMIDYTKFEPKLTRMDAYDFYRKWVAADRKVNVAAQARQFKVSAKTLRKKLKVIDCCIQLDKKDETDGVNRNHLQNWLDYRRKNGRGWSISIWSPDHPGKRQLTLPTIRPPEARKKNNGQVWNTDQGSN